jgi:hypothetical protein
MASPPPPRSATDLPAIKNEAHRGIACRGTGRGMSIAPHPAAVGPRLDHPGGPITDQLAPDHLGDEDLVAEFIGMSR